MKILKDKKGQGLVEYVVIVALVAVATMGLMRILQGTVRSNLASIIMALQGDGRRKAPQPTLTEDDWKKLDMSDFMNGAANRSGKD